MKPVPSAKFFDTTIANALADNTQKQLKLPADYQYDDGDAGDVVKPGFLFGLDAKDVKPEQRRDYFAKWVTSPKNPYFTKVIANRMWEYTFGYGLVANPDDWSNSPKPHYPELVDYVEKAMLATDYDLKQFLRILYHTDLFQRESHDRRNPLRDFLSISRAPFSDVSALKRSAIHLSRLLPVTSIPTPTTGSKKLGMIT